MPGAESQPSQPDDEPIKPEVVGVLRFELSGLALGPDHPAAARVDQEYALLLSGLHAGERADWDFEDLRRRSSTWLRKPSLDRVENCSRGSCSSTPKRSCGPPTPLSTTGTERCTACGP